jgi:4-hydroxy-2-oxoglutarate aldolase
MRVAEIVSACPADFQILTGSAGTMLAGLTVGAKGAILALGSALPEMCVALYDLYRSGEIDKARALQNTLLKASKVIQSEHAIAGIKFAMDQRGYHGGVPRSPLVPLPDSHKQRVLDMLNSLEPALARA